MTVADDFGVVSDPTPVKDGWVQVGWMTPKGGLHSKTEHHDRAHQWGPGSDCFRERCAPVYVKDQSDD